MERVRVGAGVGGSPRWDRDTQPCFPMHTRRVYSKTTHSVLCLAHEATRQAYSHGTGTSGEPSKQITAFFFTHYGHKVHTITSTKERRLSLFAKKAEAIYMFLSPAALAPFRSPRPRPSGILFLRTAEAARPRGGGLIRRAAASPQEQGCF